ncbi:hypothetical protein GIB67_011468 [Kingdonia uniflora]|uniref:Uncharacterized protein n=1 Tax=Kingdonia uniflora TaxID=39325 RepID=A0A7J7NLV8_9MAGN|nr:hypothetical protein GIB67_011468 [Kingdonia uniflora]
MNNVANPIIIDQEYCPFECCNKGSLSHVKISNVSFKDIRGISKSKLAVKLVCSKGFPCQNVKLGDINLQYTSIDGPATSTCTNVDAKIFSNVFPHQLVSNPLSLVPILEKFLLGPPLEVGSLGVVVHLIGLEIALGKNPNVKYKWLKYALEDFKEGKNGKLNVKVTVKMGLDEFIKEFKAKTTM